MFRKSKLLIVVPVTLIGLALLGGCVPSLHPLFTEEDLIFEPALLGTWKKNKDTDAAWKFTKLNENAYQLVQTDSQGRQGVFVARLVELDGAKFLDLFPKAPDPAGNGFYQFHFQPVHTFLHVKQIEPTLKVAYMNHKWMREYLKNNPDALAHTITDNPHDFRFDGRPQRKEPKLVVLTAPTSELQKFVLQHIDTKYAFTKPVELKRIVEE